MLEILRNFFPRPRKPTSLPSFKDRGPELEKIYNAGLLGDDGWKAKDTPPKHRFRLFPKRPK